MTFPSSQQAFWICHSDTFGQTGLTCFRDATTSKDRPFLCRLGVQQ